MLLGIDGITNLREGKSGQGFRLIFSKLGGNTLSKKKRALEKKKEDESLKRSRGGPRI